MWAAADAAPRTKASLIDDWNHPLVRAVEIPSANAHANAHAMATVAAALASGGLHNGVRLLSAEGVREACANGVRAADVGLGAVTENGNAGWSVFGAVSFISPAAF